jgi:hypothetical protein
MASAVMLGKKLSFALFSANSTLQADLGMPPGYEAVMQAAVVHKQQLWDHGS